jgi:hypothetical protein
MKNVTNGRAMQIFFFHASALPLVLVMSGDFHICAMNMEEVRFVYCKTLI